MPSGMTLRPFPSAALLAALLLIAACSPTPENTPAGTTAAHPATTPAGPSVATPLVARVVAAPIPVPLTDGKVHLAYELQLTNTLAQDLTLTSVDVRSGDRTLLSLPGDRLDYWTRIIGSTSPTTTIGRDMASVCVARLRARRVCVRSVGILRDAKEQYRIVSEGI